MWSHSVFRDSGVAMMVVGPAGRIGVANPAALTLMGTSSLSGADLADLVAAPDRASLDAFLAAISDIPAGRSKALGPVHLAGPDRTGEVQMIGSRTRGEGGFDALIIGVHELPTSQATGIQPVRVVDPLTGVGTRRRGLESLARATGPSAPGCLLLADLDGFGWINETLGTAEGDRILVEVAQRLLRSVPPGATVARFDGDQFLVVSSGTPGDGSLELAGVVMSALARPMEIAGTRVVTVSIGVARLDAGDVDEVLARAQSALAVAKEQGGQQVVVDGPTMTTYGRRHSDLAAALQELVSEAQHARMEAERAREEAAAAQLVAVHAQAEARTCPMTGLPNFMAYKETAQLLEADARRTGSPVAAVFLDLDEFGAINKTFSWDHGTATLTAVARILESACRGNDRLFRYGGEEFVVLLPQTDLTGARIVAERLRAAVEAVGIPHQGLPGQPVVTLSAGLAAGLGTTVVIADLVTQADGQCRLAKASGRNRVLPTASVVPPGGDVS